MSNKHYESLQDLVDDGREPVLNMEYIIVRDLPKTTYKNGKFIETVLPQDTVVTDVLKKATPEGIPDGYTFTVKNTGEKAHTNYPWALAENTTKSRSKLEEYHKLWEERDRLNKIISEKCKQLDTLAY